MSNFEKYQALIGEFGESLGFEKIHLIDDVIFSLDIDQQYELNYLYGEDTNRVLVISYFTPSYQDEIERNVNLLQANVGLSGEFIIKYGFIEKLKKVALSLELSLESNLDINQLTKATQSLMETTEYWINELCHTENQAAQKIEQVLEEGFKV